MVNACVPHTVKLGSHDGNVGLCDAICHLMTSFPEVT